MDCTPNIAVLAPPAVCVPDCSNKACGADKTGCGTSCGTCGSNELCNDKGATATCVRCIDDSQCDAGLGQHCDTTDGSCVPCYEDSHCNTCNECNPLSHTCENQTVGTEEVLKRCGADSCDNGLCLSLIHI